ncbi:MAG: ArsC family (seleno)protein [Candidatus Zixiibacteriota bacterium]
MPKADWLYFRPGCDSCNKSKAFLAKHKVTVGTSLSTKKGILGEKDAKALLKGMEQLISTRGKKVIKVNLKTEKLPWKELAPLMLGPLGNLRAPVIQRGTTILVGFDEDSYKELMK